MSLTNANPFHRHPQSIKWLLRLAIFAPQTSHFSSTSRSLLAAPPLSRARSPRARAEQITRANVHPTSTQSPTQLLKEAAHSGQLAMSAEVAEAVLNDFQRLDGPSIGNLERICSERGIQPVGLTKLAKVLMNSPGSVDKKIVGELFSAAMELKDPSGTLIIRETALKYGRPIPLACAQHMKRMVTKKNYAALYVQGQIYEAEKQDSLAIKMYTESLSSAAKGYPGAEAFDITIGEVWTGIYRLKSQQKDEEGAHLAIQRAAFECDEPSAYYILARDFAPQGSDEYIDYMLQAASSGEPRAADALGSHFLEKYQGIHPYSSKESLDGLVKKLAGEEANSGKARLLPQAQLARRRRKLELAREWYRIAGEADITSSQVHLAVILRYEGRLAQGLRSLVRAREKQGWPNTIAWLEKHWESDSVDYLQINIENLRLLLDGDG